MNKQELITRIKCLDEPYLKEEFILDLIEQLDEPQKPVVPKFVAEWYEENKNNLDKNIYDCIVGWGIHSKEIRDWMRETSPIQTLVNMHQFGYEVEKEKRYTVKMRTTNQPLFYNSLEKKLFFSLGELATQFTFKQLEEAGLGWVFDCEGMEVEKVGK